MSGRDARRRGLTTALLLLPFRVITLVNKQRRGRRGAGSVPVSSYLAGEGARAGAFGFGVLDSAVLVGIEHPSCKTTDGLSRLETAVPPAPSSSRPALWEHRPRPSLSRQRPALCSSFSRGLLHSLLATLLAIFPTAQRTYADPTSRVKSLPTGSLAVRESTKAESGEGTAVSRCQGCFNVKSASYDPQGVKDSGQSLIKHKKLTYR